MEYIPIFRMIEPTGGAMRAEHSEAMARDMEDLKRYAGVESCMIAIETITLPILSAVGVEFDMQLQPTPVRTKDRRWFSGSANLSSFRCL